MTPEDMARTIAQRLSDTARKEEGPYVASAGTKAVLYVRTPDGVRLRIEVAGA